MASEALAEAVARAAPPQPLWALVPSDARARYLARTAQALLDELDEIADGLAASAGIPRTEALVAELVPSIAGLRALAREGPQALAPQRLGRRPVLRAGRRSVLRRVPVGVAGIRSGVASPWAEPVLEAAAALLGGNGVVLAPEAAAPAERLAAAAARAGLPEGLLQVLTPQPELAELEDACDAAADTEPETAKGAVLVLAGAPLGRAVSATLWAGYSRAGRGPAAVGRVIVERAVADPLLRRLEAGARALRVGDPAQPDTEVGPLASPEDLARVQELVEEAVAGGATLLCGGPVTVPGSDAPFYAPALLRGVSPGARLLAEPAPGPVLAVLEAASEADAVGLARRNSPSVSVWARDRELGERVARALDVELSWVNEHGTAPPAVPVRLARWTRAQQIASQPVALRSARWLPHDPVLVRASIASTRLQHGRRSERGAALRSGAIPVARVVAGLVRETLRR